VGGYSFWLAWLCLAALFGGPVLPVLASELIEVEALGLVDIRADQVIFDENAKSYLATGEVEIVRGVNRIFADKVRLNSETLIAEAEGRVRVTTTTEVLTGERIIVDLQSGTGKVYNGLIFVRPAYYYLRGEEIEKTGKDTYKMRYGGFTTCDGNQPAWEVTGRDMEVSIEGYGSAYDAYFRVRNIPLLYAPYALFPAKVKRQSGLLPPVTGYSNRDGFFISQPWFQTLDDSHDMTVTLNYMSKRGVDTSLEYRYAFEKASKGMFTIDYLSNDGIAKELKDQFKNADAWHTRYWFRGKADQQLFNDTMTLTLDLDLASDRDYLREFAYGYTGYDNSKDHYDQWFGRNFDPDTSTVRENKLNLQRYWASSTFNASMIYYDDLATNTNTTLQYLPTITYEAMRQAMGNTGLYFQMGSGYTYYYREECSKGHVLDVVPTISLPFNFNNYLELEPSFTYRERAYNATRDWNDASNAKTSGLSQLWSFNTTASSYTYRVYETGPADDPLKIKHTMRPNMTYSYTPNISQYDVALLARYGQPRHNVVSYGLDTTLTSKKIQQDEETGEVRPVYHEFLKLALAHSFDVDQPRLGESRGVESRPWGTFDSRMQIYTSKFFLLQGDSSWNPYVNNVEHLNGLLMTRDHRGDYISLDYLYTQDYVKQIATKLKLAVTKEWFVGWTNHKDLNDNNEFQSIYEVGYEGRCWGVRAFYQDDSQQRGLFLAFSLGGFGELLSRSWLHDTSTNRN
jgi:LPS-assembly protein